ncbi:hypothetical protein PNQ69_16615 [Xanthomonas sp. A2111]|uniref:Uncharacterized protein n=1 Tax=Xanthomonas hawaiiensis TaxID=3003247 RepID=A0ABU2I8D3_9XANT|nr:hypothetical protein [Xanthomonas sp. A2111]MDS9994389.1 hypothetical protein [Xanthomonas sp. A2111]
MIEGENWNTIDRHGDLRWRPVEVDTPLRRLQWFWHPNSDQALQARHGADRRRRRAAT